MKKSKALIGGTAIAALTIYLTGPSLAQEEDGRLRVSLGLQQTIGSGDNLSLGVAGSAANPEEGRSSLATTDLALNIASETRSDSFNLLLGGSLRFGSLPAGSRTETGFVDPVAELHYSRESANATFSFDASYNESDISGSRPLWDFSDEENVIQPPSDLASLTGTGTRKASDMRLDLQTGLNSPIGFHLTAGAGRIRYSNASSATLTPSDRANVGLSTLFRFDQATTAVLDLRATRYDNSVGPASKTETVEAGFDRELANGGKFSVRLGYTDIKNGTATGSSGGSGSLSYGAPLPNGSYLASYSLSRTSNGSIDTVRFNRAFTLPTGSLSVDLGASSLQGATPRVIGGLNWLRQTPTGNYSVRLNRSVTSDGNNQDRFTTTLAAQFSHKVNAYSSVYTNFSYYLTDSTAAENQVERTNLSVGYAYALTDDWALNAGVSLVSRNESLGGAPGSTTLGKAKSNQVFVSLSRRFDLN